MRTLIIVPVLLVLAFLSACCQKKTCYEEHYISVNLKNFTDNEMDTILVTGYATDGSFSKITSDTEICFGFKITSLDSTYTLISHQDNRLRDNQYYQIFIPATKTSYRISDYVYSDSVCSSCSYGRDDISKNLSGCKLNGVEHMGTVLTIYK